jgi:hypothetical protein
MVASFRRSQAHIAMGEPTAEGLDNASGLIAFNVEGGGPEGLALDSGAVDAGAGAEPVVGVDLAEARSAGGGAGAGSVGPAKQAAGGRGNSSAATGPALDGAGA